MPISLIVLLTLIAMALAVLHASSPPRVPLWTSVFVLCVVVLMVVLR